MKKPRLADLGAALAEGLVAAGIASVVIAAVAYVAPGMIGSRRAAIDAVILVGCGVFVSRLVSGRGPEWFGAEAGVSLAWRLLRVLPAALVAFVGTLAFFYLVPSRHLFRGVAVLVFIVMLFGVLVSRRVSTRRGPELARALLTALVAVWIASVVIFAVFYVFPSWYFRGVAEPVLILTFSGVFVWRLVSTRRGFK